MVESGPLMGTIEEILPSGKLRVRVGGGCPVVDVASFEGAEVGHEVMVEEVPSTGPHVGQSHRAMSSRPSPDQPWKAV
jgi:hypothetical protein